MLQYILMGAQAAGSIMSYRTQKHAAGLEQQQIALRLKQETLASNQQSLYNLRSLEETLASQRAIMAARGVSAGAGSARGVQNRSVRAYNRDEEARKLSLDFLTTQRNVQSSQMSVGRYGAKAQMGMDIFKAALGAMPGSSPGGAFGGFGGSGNKQGLLTGEFGD